MKYYGVIFIAVFELVATVGISLFIGSRMDAHFHHENVFTMGITILGFIFGFYRLTVRLKKIMDNPDA